MTLSNEGFAATAYGIIAKVADFYGITSPSALLKRLEIAAPRSPMGYTEELVNTVLSNSAIRDDISRFIPSLSNIVMYDERYPKIAHSKKVKVCKKCIAEGHLHREIWQQVHYTVCLKHSVALSDSCEHIYANSEWPKEIGCKHCVRNVSVSAIPEYLLHWSEIAYKDDADTFLNNLFSIAEHMVRPFDYFEVQIAWSKLTVAEAIQILEDAFILSGRSETLDVWTTLLQNHRQPIASLGTEGMTYGLENIKFWVKKANWNTSKIKYDIENTLTRYHENLSINQLRTRYHIFKEDDGDAVSFKATGTVVGQLLDVDERGLTELVRNNILPVKKPSARSDKLIFDVRDVISAIKRIFVYPHTGFVKAVSVAGISQTVLDTLLLDTKRITSHLLSGRLKGYLAINSTTSLINRSTLSAESLSELFEYELENSDHLSLTATAKLLGIHATGVKGLIERQLLRWAPWQRTCGQFVDIASIKTLLADFLCINREAILKEVSVPAIVDDVLNCCGTLPDVHFREFRDPVTVMLYKKASLSPCCLALVENQLEALEIVGVDLSKKVKRFANAA
ncbi:MAG: hypothetical protein CL587_02120 [Alteromonadaceae bacterium]|nr:hypothetical protein [Alteromonadaceae bacterium]